MNGVALLGFLGCLLWIVSITTRSLTQGYTIKEQQRQIDELKRELEEMKRKQ